LNWLQKDPLAVKVSQLSSIKTQLPYSYYSLPFCRPDAIVDSAENLGELLRGDRIENTPYVVSTPIVHACLLCFSGALNTHETLNFCSSR
jgi:transmembrane 9 superfamily protein 2/4